MLLIRLRINMLGSFQVLLDEEPSRGFEYDKVRALLAYLVVEAGRPHRREALAGLLWADQPESVARNSLRTALSKLRRATGDRSAEPPVFEISRETIQFNKTSDYCLDVAEFSALLEECERHPHRRLDSCMACAHRQEAAAHLYRGDFLAGFSLADSPAFEDWVAFRREQHHRQVLNALYHLANFHERRAEYGRAYQYAAKQITLEPWREEAHRQAMRALAFDGQRSGALAQYEACREILDAELGVAPGPETALLYERIRSETLGESPADRRIVGTVPEAATSMVGRQEELIELRDLLLDPNCRLVTLTGMAGIGKTRLAQAVALDMELDFPHGVAFVPLAAEASEQELVAATTDALRLRLQGGRPEKEQLFAFLQGKELLLVLDNFEQLLPGVDLLVELIRKAPGLVLLVTSRERLNLQVEWVFDLAGLSYPANPRPGNLERYAAAELFVQRARQVQREFSMSAADALAVAHICRLCEGMPLAIELAAATVRFRSAPQIAGQLQSNWQELAATYSDLPERHQSIQAAFEHSWALLSEREQELFSKMSLFQGGFGEEASARVALATRAELLALIDKSLVQRVGDGRFSMHPLIRQFATDKLRRLNQYEVTQDRHGAYYLTFAEQAQPLLEGGSQARWLDHLEAEHDNLRAALNWAKAKQHVEQGARLAEALSLFWFMRGYITEGRQQLAAFLHLVGEETEPKLRARLLDRAGFLARYQGDYDSAYTLIGEGLAICRRLDDDHATADALASLGFVVLRRSDLVQARSHYAEALAIHRRLNNGQGIADSQSHLALISSFEGDYDAARRRAEESLYIWRDLGDKHGMAWALCVLGMAMFRQTDLRAAGKHFKEGLQIASEIDVKWEIALSLEGIARVAAAQNQPESALYLAGGAAALREAVGVPLSTVEAREIEEDLAPTYEVLDQQSAATAWKEGQEQDLADLVHYALEETTLGTTPP